MAASALIDILEIITGISKLVPLIDFNFTEKNSSQGSSHESTQLLVNTWKYFIRRFLLLLILVFSSGIGISRIASNYYNYSGMLIFENLTQSINLL